MDWTKTVEYWVVKLDGTNPQKDQEVRNLLISKGNIKSVWDMRSDCKKRKNCVETKYLTDEIATRELFHIH